ncbi:MAG: hypothetical protein PWP37_1695 [Thermotogota bacterium]|nr:hypothetical protein [Thermotogota bacterium]
MNARFFFSLLILLIILVIVDNVSAGGVSNLLINATAPGIEALGTFKVFFNDLRTCFTHVRKGKSITLDYEYLKPLSLRYGILTLFAKDVKALEGQLVLASGFPIGKVIRVEDSLVKVRTFWNNDLKMPVYTGNSKDVVFFRGGNPPTVEVLDEVTLEPGEPVKLAEFPALPEASSVVGTVYEHIGNNVYSVKLLVELEKLPSNLSLFP